ncbi:MAG: type II toxin-antitoxin system RelE/ParE family toxin [Methylococcus sp.]
MIWDSIAQDNPTAATRQLRRIEDQCQQLANHPQMGPARRDIAPELRYFPVGSYLILYRILPGAIEVVRVLHGARDISALF